MLAASSGDTRPDDDRFESPTECDEEDEFLKTLAAEYLSVDTTSKPVSAQLAAILDKSWSASLSDAKLKEKLAKYDRPENCGRLLAPKGNPEIWSRISNLGQRQDLKFVAVQKALASAGSALAKSTQALLVHRHLSPRTEDQVNSQWDTILKSQIDALALLGHANFQLSLRRREMLKPFLKQEYASLCSSQTAVSSLLLGDELKTKLAAIRASNRISNTAIGPDRGSVRTRGAPFTRSWRSRNTDRERPFFYKSPKTPQATQTTERGEQEVTHSQMVHRLNSLEVSEYMAFLPSLKEHFIQQIASFEGGGIKWFFSHWQEITNDPEILDMVSGTHIEFQSIPTQTRPKTSSKFSPQECATIQAEISNLLRKSFIVQTHHAPGEFISPIFVRPKKDGTSRMILNLQSLNEHVVYLHFKMDTLKDAIRLMKPNCFMESIDLKDAYYPVPIAPADQKYLKFQWETNLYAFTCFPNGLAFCPRKFTKLLKPVYSTLRQLGHVSSPYIDDSYLQGDDYYSCLANIVDTNIVESVLVPTQRLIFLGFILDSLLMRIYMTPDKVAKVIDLCSNLLRTRSPTIRTVSQVLGYIISTFPGVMFGPLYFRHLERDKSQALTQANGNFDLPMHVSVAATQELSWWVSSAPTAYNVISHGDPAVTLTTDASQARLGMYARYNSYWRDVVTRRNFSSY